MLSVARPYSLHAVTGTSTVFEPPPIIVRVVSIIIAVDGRSKRNGQASSETYVLLQQVQDECERGKDRPLRRS